MAGYLSEEGSLKLHRLRSLEFQFSFDIESVRGHDREIYGYDEESGSEEGEESNAAHTAPADFTDLLKICADVCGGTLESLAIYAFLDRPDPVPVQDLARALRWFPKLKKLLLPKCLIAKDAGRRDILSYIRILSQECSSLDTVKIHNGCDINVYQVLREVASLMINGPVKTITKIFSGFLEIEDLINDED